MRFSTIAELDAGWMHWRPRGDRRRGASVDAVLSATRREWKSRTHRLRPRAHPLQTLATHGSRRNLAVIITIIVPAR
jgi:hypothetical protein